MTKFRLKELRDLNREEMNVRNYVLNNLNKEKKKSTEGYLVITTVVSIAIIVFMVNVFEQSTKLHETSIRETPSHETSAMGGAHSEEIHKQIEELSTIWATALQTRDGKPRYDMLSEKGKEKFIQQQVVTSGENYNFVIGVSSPWVVSFEIEIDEMTAMITYQMQTSESSDYQMVETVHFIEDVNGEMIVDDFQSTDVTKSNPTTNINQLELTTEEAIDIFQRAVSNSTKVPGIADMISPQYQFSLDDNTYFLWISDESGTIMNVNDTHTIYTLSSVSINEISDFLQD